MKEVYGIHPTFVHVDKDMAEINAVKEVWNPKIQLCWWHLRKAVRERLKKTKLSTTPYNAMEAHTEFSFIDPRFTPNGRPDATETEGLPIFGTPNKDSNPADEFDAGPRQFCPERHRDGILELIEKHFCAHPLIPDYCPPNLVCTITAWITTCMKYGLTSGRIGTEQIGGHSGHGVHSMRSRG